MIAPAQLYESQLQVLFIKTFQNDRYKFYHAGSFHDKYTSLTSTWNAEEYVVLDPEENIIGYIKYRHDRETRAVYGLHAISFSDENSLTFVRELYKMIIDLMYKYNHSKLSFEVVVGNPTESSYDHLVDLLGGRIVGIKKNEIILKDNNLYDFKLYEVLNTEFREALSKSHRLQRFIKKYTEGF